jgi:hypothetical protein
MRQIVRLETVISKNEWVVRIKEISREWVINPKPLETAEPV